MYNSAGRFSTPLKTFSSRRVFRPFIEQGASPPVLWSRGASPPPPGGVFFPGRACQRCNIAAAIKSSLKVLAKILTGVFKLADTPDKILRYLILIISIIQARLGRCVPSISKS